MTPLLLDSSVAVRAVLEKSLSTKTRRLLASSSVLMASRLALVESARAILRAKIEGRISEPGLTRAESDLRDLWTRCEVWEISRSICSEATEIAPTSALRTLDAIHLATFLAARRKLPSIRLLVSDARMLEVARTLGFRVLEA